MNRRHFMAMLGYASASSMLPFSKRAIAENQDFIPHDGELLVTVHANGGWDVSSFCDPKVIYNAWADGMAEDDLPRAGNIPYAPLPNADNQAFFEKYHEYMLVINGVDCQSNSHRVGPIHNWSGRTANGYPSLPALFAYEKSPSVPIPYLSFGGYNQTAGLVRYSRLEDLEVLTNVLKPNINSSNRGDKYHLPASDLDRLIEAQTARISRLSMREKILPRQQKTIEAYADALPKYRDLEGFAAIVDGEEIESSNLLLQAQVSVLAFKAGVTSAADLSVGGFDTHDNNDTGQANALSNLTQLVDYLWDYAEEHGVADRLTVVIGSDFARGPNYGSNNGKNHWPIGSLITMRKNAAWGNRVVQGTDAEQNALSLNPTTLEVDDSAGSSIIYPKHVHSALRGLLNLSPVGFDLNNLEEFNFFNV